MKNSSTVLIVSVIVAFLFVFGLVFFLKPDPEPVNLPISVEEYSDFACPACAAYSEVHTLLDAEFGENVVFEYMHFPLAIPGHERAPMAALASEAAREQGKFNEYHDLLFANQGKFEDEDFVGYAEQLELDVEKFKTDYESEEIKTRVDGVIAKGNEMGINSTPSFYINGEKYNATGPDSIVNKVRELVERAQ